MFRRITIGALAALLLTAAVSAEAGERVRYDDWKGIDVMVNTPAELELMLSISPQFLSCDPRLGLQPWLVPPEQVSALDASGLHYEIVYDDFQKLIDREWERLQQDGRGWYANYKTLDEINTHLDELVAARPDLVTKFEVGESLEGRTLYGLRITSPIGSDKAGVMFDGTQHAREWIGPMTVMYIAEQLVTGYDIDPEIQELLDQAVFYIIPVVNVDGYVYSWTTDRMWRKNRRHVGSGIYGVDLNRNWATGWGGAGSSGDPGDETYRGTEPFSEPETTIVRDFITAHPDIQAHIDFHSYSQLILYPYGYDYVLPPEPDLTTFVELGAEMASAIYDVHGMTYVDQASHALYLGSGEMTDWVYDANGAFSFTIELRPEGWPGFELPPEEILPTAEENFAAIKVLAGYLTKLLVFSFPDGLPTIVQPDQPTPITVAITELGGTLDPDSPRLFSRIGDTGEFTESTMTPLGGSRFEATLPAAECGSRIHYYFQAQTTGGAAVTEPIDAPSSTYAADVFEISITFEDHMESDLGWTVGSPDDDATTGVWDRTDPEATAAQPGDDHTPDGTICWVTDGRAGSGVGSYDIDGGQTTLTSPVLDLSAVEDPLIGYWRWYSNDQGSSPGADIFVVDISLDGGDNWINAETVGPTGPEASGGWYYHEIRVTDIAPPTDRVLVRFIASDEGAGSIVEAAVDDFVVLEIGCDEIPCPGDLDGDGERGLSDLATLLANYGLASGAVYEDGDMDGDEDVDLADLAALLAVYGIPCP